MKLEFRYALFAAGAFLIAMGAIPFTADFASSNPSPGVLEAFSRGFDTIFMALFSGVLIGTGIALVGNGFVLHTIGSRRHILLAAICSLLFLALSAFAVFNRGANPLLALMAFFAFISASAAFLFAALWYALSNVARNCFLSR
jgi:hypothetical protein